MEFEKKKEFWKKVELNIIAFILSVGQLVARLYLHQSGKAVQLTCMNLVPTFTSCNHLV